MSLHTVKNLVTCSGHQFEQDCSTPLQYGSLKYPAVIYTGMFYFRHDYSELQQAKVANRHHRFGIHYTQRLMPKHYREAALIDVYRPTLCYVAIWHYILSLEIQTHISKNALKIRVIMKNV